ncbi:hypothetical protein DYL61_19900 [Pseudomonas nabeulensis]|uniref:Dermonecrotic toxin N-terminal domain-containing protein n=1 Tax=Pseudomonas nabeulensis TaxID=2293833 RepID=A0A4Z0AVX3_9PSED|nr:DUF6543 domain-containing protein [Pseudomonas nabeulensis]TFY90956.1 hypothetical protein DYL61_19900 [Pseudomonas nabeulensis]
MARVTPPYFFDEFLQPIRRVKPSERERALGLTLKDLDWLHTLYYATDAGRQNPAHLGAPMVVESLQVNLAKPPAIPLAGVFLMSPSPDANKAVLYTPYGGLEVFDTRDTLLAGLTTRLNDPAQRVDLCRFLSIAQRARLSLDKTLSLSATLIAGAVMEDQERVLQAAQLQNVQAMLVQLRKTPTLPWMLDTLLTIMGRSYFPALDQRDTRMDCYVANNNGGSVQRLLTSMPLSQALLQFYVQQSWPTDKTRRFYNPRQLTSSLSEAQQAQLHEQWDSLVEQTAGIFSKLLNSLMLTYWNEDFDTGQSRLEFFAQVMSDKFRLDLLLKRQNGILSATESHLLLAMFLPDHAARTAYADTLRIEKVRVQAPYQHYVDLAGTLMISDSYAYLYTQARGLQVLKDMDDLKDTLRSMLKASGHEDELLNVVSQEEHSLFIGLDQVQVTGLPIASGVFQEMIEDIATKQLSNLEYALGLYRRSNGTVDLDALLDHALDLRAMLDNRLLTLDTGGRWTLHPVSSGNGRPSTVQAEHSKQRLLPLQAATAALALERSSAPTLRRLVTHALNTELEKRQQDLKSDEVHINTYDTPTQEREERLPLKSLNLVEHFIERLANQAGPITQSSYIGFYGPREEGAAKRLNSLNTRTVNAIIDQVMLSFVQHDLRTLPRVFLESQQSRLSQSLMLGLRNEADLRLLSKTLTPRGQAILDTVLRPDSLTRINRHGLNGFLPDAFALTLTLGDDPTPHPLANCFVLTERGGVDPQRSGQAQLWTPRNGHETFLSIEALRTHLQQRLDDPRTRVPLLENLHITRQAPHQVYRLGPLQRIDGNLLDDRQQSYRLYLNDAIDYLMTMKLGPRQLQDCLDALMQQSPPTNLARATAVAQSIILQQALPVWLGLASPAEQIQHAELMEQYRLSAAGDRDYLHGIPQLRTHVAARLSELLEARYPGQGLSPDNVMIPERRALEGDQQTLTDFALRHHPDLQGTDIRPHSRTATPLPPALNASAVVQMVQQLGLESTYSTWFAEHLPAETEDARERRRLFCRQLPWQMLTFAHEEKLEERLSANAWSLIQQVFDMPDGVARSAVAGANAIIRPLELIATEGATPALVNAVYLITPPTGESGPWVLYAPYSPLYPLKEYQREEDLIREISTPGALQNWILRRLDDPHQATYRHLLPQQVSPSASEVRVGRSPILGNILWRLFKDNIQLLMKLSASQFDKLGGPEWHSLANLLREGPAAAVEFIQGKLRFPLVVWRSYKILKVAMEDLQQQRFVRGFRGVIRGLAQLASLRKELASSPEPSPPLPANRPLEWEDESTLPAITLADLNVTDPSRTHLQALENHGVALTDLVHNATSHVYEDKASVGAFVPLAGKVYPVRKAGEHWRLSDGEQHGPYVRCDTANKWVLDLDKHHPRFGKTLSRHSHRYYTRVAERQAMNIEAIGMRAIAAMSSWRAQAINEALNVATYYAVNCKRNILNYAKIRDPGSRMGRFFTELFGVLTLAPAQLQKIEDCVDEVLGDLVHHSLTSPDSMRFVCGTANLADASTFAFTLPDDADQKIYLLNPFFDPPFDIYENRLNTPFNIVAHARAAVLIHELSHLKCLTEDMAYLDSMRPFPDLINMSIRGAPVLKTQLVDLRDTALSVLTPASLLFKSWNEWVSAWEDFGMSRDSTSVKRKVLQTTGTRTLDDARQIFMTDPDKRIATILGNADSVTYLITQVGRMLDLGA